MPLLELSCWKLLQAGLGGPKCGSWWLYYVVCHLPKCTNMTRWVVWGDVGHSTCSLPTCLLTLVLSSSHPLSALGASGPHLDVLIHAGLANPRARALATFLQPLFIWQAPTQNNFNLRWCQAGPPTHDGDPLQYSVLPQGSSILFPLLREACRRLERMVGPWHHLVSIFHIWVCRPPGRGEQGRGGERRAGGG